MPETKLPGNPPSPVRHPGLIALWLLLAAGYLAASATGLRVVAMPSLDS